MIKNKINTSQIKPQIFFGIDDNRQLLSEMRMAKQAEAERKAMLDTDSSNLNYIPQGSIRGKRKSNYSELQHYFERPKVSTGSDDLPLGMVRLNKRENSNENVNQRQFDQESQDSSEFEEVPKDLIGPKVNKENIDSVLDNTDQKKNMLNKFLSKLTSNYSPLTQMKQDKIEEFEE